MTNLGVAQSHGRPSLHQESGHFEIAAGERVVERSHAVALGASGIVDIGAAFQQQGHNLCKKLGFFNLFIYSIYYIFGGTNFERR